jgi:hypothetical protein
MSENESGTESRVDALSATWIKTYAPDGCTRFRRLLEYFPDTFPILE